MFLGPSGVDKMELAEALDESLFDDERALTRMDMSEFMSRGAWASAAMFPERASKDFAAPAAPGRRGAVRRTHQRLDPSPGRSRPPRRPRRLRATAPGLRES
jgi:hypothetical protein